MVYVLTIDQRGSQAAGDGIPDLLVALNRRTRKAGLLRRFERTAGDEAQGMLSTAAATVEVVAELLRADSWSIGLGLGEVEDPLPRSTRAGRGSAFVHARDAVTRAKSSPHHVNVVGADGYRADQLETVLWLLAWVLRRRTVRGWEVADLLADGLSRRDVGVKLGISQSAVTQRAQAAGVVEEQRARLLAVQLLGATDQEDVQ
ncbi:MAG: transposase [Nocardioidaceae bacterium]